MSVFVTHPWSKKLPTAVLMLRHVQRRPVICEGTSSYHAYPSKHQSNVPVSKIAQVMHSLHSICPDSEASRTAANKPSGISTWHAPACNFCKVIFTIDE
jgi:hypothetical protein